MKALIKKERAPGIWMEDIPIPTPKENEVLIRTKKTAICGTDVHIYKWDAWSQKTVIPPLVIGHEFVGEIVQIGSQVKGLKIGERISGEGHLVCGQCAFCRKGLKHLCPQTRGLGYHHSGCFAEYFTLPAENVFVLPSSISDDLAAILDPLGNAIHTALTFNLIGEDVLITGVGPVGLMATAIAKKVGAHRIVVTDANDYRLNLARHLGATDTVNITRTSLSDALKSLGIKNGFGIGLEMSGHPDGLRDLVEQVHHGGKIALLGLLPPNTPIDWDLVIFKMLTIKGIYGREIFNTWYQMVALIESGLDITPIITHHFPATRFQEAFDVMMSGQSGKVILDWDSL